MDHAITGPKSGASFKIGTPITFTGRFWDVPESRHSAQWSFDSLVGAGTVVEPTATKAGAVTGTYAFNDPGVYGVRLKMTDSLGAFDTVDNIGDLDAIVVVYDPNGGYDKFRLKIWNKTSSQVVYDTQPGAPDNADPTTIVGDGSSIVIQPK